MIELYEFEEEPESPNLCRETALRGYDFMKSVAFTINGVRGKRGKLFAWDCYLLMMGFSEVNDIESASDLARKWKCTKAHVTNMVKTFQSPAFLNLPPMPGQRSLSGCSNMTASRKEQLNNNSSHD